MDRETVPAEPETVSPQADATFELERFAWLTPDRLELSGTFAGLADVPNGAPVLILHGADGPLRLPADPETVSGAPADGKPWHAAFAWQEAPVPFDEAELELGAGLAVTLPGPDSEPTPGEALPVRRSAVPAEPTEDGSTAVELEPLEDGSPTVPAVPLEDGAQLLGAQAAQLVAEQEARELRAALEQAQAEVERAREDLRAERERHADDAESFREGLETVRSSLEAELAAARSAADAGARKEIEALRAQNVVLEAAREDDRVEMERLRARLAAVREAIEDAE